MICKRLDDGFVEHRRLTEHLLKTTGDEKKVNALRHEQMFHLIADFTSELSKTPPVHVSQIASAKELDAL